MKTDDDFIIGEFTESTGFLILLGVASGVLLAIAYSIGRLWFPERYRAAVAATAFGIGGGAAIVHPGGIDFVVLEPLWLAIALFVVVPAAEGWLVAVLVERFLAESSVLNRWPPWLALPLALAPLLVFGLFGVFLIVVAGAMAVVIAQADADVGERWTSPALSWIGRAAIAAVTMWSGVALVRDSVKILS